jgi:hypothetical protein
VLHVAGRVGGYRLIVVNVPPQVQGSLTTMRDSAIASGA